MKNLLRSIAALALALGGVLVAISAPASAAGKTKTVACYKLVHNKVQSHKFKNAKGVCAKNWSKHKPTSKPSTSVQGSNARGDIDLNVPGSASLSINGSSFDAPLVGVTTSGSSGYSAGGKVSFSAYPAAGSGSGRAGVTNGSLSIGFSDVPMTGPAGTLPAGVTESNYAQVPYLLGGAVMGYNLGSGFNNLKLTASEVAEIYNGKITLWSDPLIVATNGGTATSIGKALTALGTNSEARNTIKVLYRAASSGTTEAFTYWLYQAGSSGIAPSGGGVMEGTGGAWKAGNIDGVANNAAMAQGIDNTLGSIGYVEFSYVLIPGNDTIQVASLQDKSGEWLQPSLTNIANSAAAAGTTVSPDNFSITNEPGKNVWPLATYSWAIVPKAQTNEATCEAATKYLDWVANYGQVKDA
ncbi:MAG: substrate-binding domain-containing protein, partial [Acidimicrobiales bacterium]